MTRRFSDHDRVALFLAADGRCEECGAELAAGWHADHVTPWSAGGPTDVINGQALCPDCNLRKGSSVDRQWQIRAYEEYRRLNVPDFVLNVCPAAGKTRWALSVARDLVRTGSIRRIVVVVPSVPLRGQWADAAAHYDLSLNPKADNAQLTTRSGRWEQASDIDGIVVTYAQVAAEPTLHRRLCQEPTLVIFDEIHHAGDAEAWGEAIRIAYDQAARRIALTGTLFRPRPDQVIPFVNYTDGVAVSHFSYSYGAAIADGVCRRTEFLVYDGQVRWIEAFGADNERVVKVSELDDDTRSIGLGSLYMPDGVYMQDMIRLAHDRLMEHREESPDAGGLLLASRQHEARAIAPIVAAITGTTPAIAISDDPGAHDEIERFRDGRAPWLIAVGMVSEGVDIPRLSVGVWASKITTELFFRQVVGRFARKRPGESLNAALFLPAVDQLVDYAMSVETEAQHAIKELEEEIQRQATEAAASQMHFTERVPLHPGSPELDRIITQGETFNGDPLEAARMTAKRYGFSERDVVRVARLLRDLDTTATVDITVTPDPAPEPLWRLKDARQSDLRILANRYAHASGRPYREVNAAIATSIGAYRDQATLEQLEHGIEVVTKWLAQQ